MKKVTPEAVNKDFVEQNLQNEILLYNLKTNKAYCLNETAGLVYRYCDGKTDFNEIRLKSGKDLPDEIIELAIDELSRCELVGFRPQTKSSRRRLLQQAVSCAVALPLITALAAPTAAQTSSVACINEGGAPNGTIVGQSNQQQEIFCGTFSGDCCSDFTAETNCVTLPGGFRNCDCVCVATPPGV